MYVTEITLENVKTYSLFDARFPNPAGWHVFIGDNGSGKTTLIREIVKVFSVNSFFKGDISEVNGIATQKSEFGWIKRGQYWQIKLGIEFDSHFDFDREESPTLPNETPSYQSIYIINETHMGWNFKVLDNTIEEYNIMSPSFHKKGKFSISFGPFRRFTGGNAEINKLFKDSPRDAAHLSPFREDVSFIHTVDWLIALRFKELEENKSAKKTLAAVKYFINASGLLPDGAQIGAISSDGVFLIDGNGVNIHILDASDGYRSILSVALTIIWYMTEIYGADLVFSSETPERIDLPGVVLIDEIDAHLHPTWQTRIGVWFIEKFPKLQFIVTTHSPLICRACHKGSIWRLAAPGSEEESREITGVEKDRLVYGNVLDAYATDLFGEEITRSEDGKEKYQKLTSLLKKSYKDETSPEEEEEIRHLRDVFISGK